MKTVPPPILLVRGHELRPRRGGFSLVELLAVIAIMATIAILVVAGTGNITSYRITTSAADLSSTAALARQIAMSSGTPVDLRFYKKANTDPDFSAFRLVEVRASGEQNAQRMRNLPDGIVIKGDAVTSTIFGNTTSGDPIARSMTDPQPGGMDGSSVRYIRYLPDGSIERLATEKPFWATLVSATAPVVDSSYNLPANYAAVSFEPLLGGIAVYRP